MKTVDVVIIGAGPAGAMAAQKIAADGHEVVLIERKKEVGKPIQCAEAITQFALDNTGLPVQEKWVRQAVKGVKILLPKEKRFYSKVPGFSINRMVFDQWLTEKAVDNGSDLQTNCTMKKLVKKHEHWIVHTTKGKVKTKIVVGADGAESRTAQLTGLLKEKVYIKGFQYTFNKNDISFPISDWLCMHMDEQFLGGYGWVFPRGNEYNVGVGSLQGSISMLNTYCDQLDFDKSKRTRITAGLVPFSFTFSKRTKDRVVIIGDAAGLVNPVTGGGIHSALYSGKIAGSIINEALQTDDFTKLNSYDTMIQKSMFLHPIHRKTANYFQHWTNKDWDFFGTAADGLEMEDLTLWKCLKIGFNNPTYMLRAKELLTIRKDMQLNKKYGW